MGGIRGLGELVRRVDSGEGTCAFAMYPTTLDQLMAIADAYDALTSERCYKKAFPHETAVQMITNGECGAFNPLLLQCLLDVQGELKQEILQW